MSTTLIQPGSEFKLNSTASVRSILSGRLGAYLLGAALRGSACHRAWVRVALRNGTQWGQPSKRKAAETVVTDTMPGRRKARGRPVDLKETMAGIQATLGVGGLIHVAVGLSGGVGFLLTKRSGYSWNA